MSCVDGNLGFYNWYGSRDKDGFREYHVIFKVVVDDSVLAPQGPATALSMPGLFLPGAPYVCGGDVDLDAICQWTAEMKPMVEERTKYFTVEQVFSSRPNEKCINRVGTGTGTGNPSNDPLLEPPVIRGSFVKYTEEKTKDKDGVYFTNSAHERIRGPLVEFDSSRATISVTINEHSLNLADKLAWIDTVNQILMWDFTERLVKLSNITWEQKFSNDCTCYYQSTYEFEASPEGFDRVALDEATKVLRGEWNKTTPGQWDLIGTPNANNPKDFIRATDIYDNPMRIVLNGSGVPAANGEEGSIDLIYYTETDFLAEIDGLPSSLECAT